MRCFDVWILIRVFQNIQRGIIYLLSVKLKDFFLISQVRDRLPQLKTIVQYSPEPVDPEQLEQGVIAWDDFLKIGKVSSRRRSDLRGLI